MALASGECSDDRPPVDLPGVALRRRRELRGLTIDDLSGTTKISKPVLRAIEATDVAHLPASIYTRGFVRSYAAEVGLPPDETADDYLRFIAPGRVHHIEPAAERAPAPNLAARVDVNDDARHVLAANQVQRAGWLAMLAAAVGVVIYLVSAPRPDSASARRLPGFTDAPNVAHAGGQYEDQAPVADAAPAAMADTPLRVELTPHGPCWVSIRIGGETVLAKLLQAGDRETIDLGDDAVVRVGEPGALSYSINGQSGRALGPAGQPVTVRITKDNFRDFLSS